MQRCGFECAVTAEIPASDAAGLQQENIVAIIVRPNRSPGRSETDHDVIEAPIREEADLLKEWLEARHVEIHTIDEQRPVPVAKGIKARCIEGPLLLLIAVRRPANDARVGVGFAGKPGKLVRIEGHVETLEGIRQKQGALAPEMLKKVRKAGIFIRPRQHTRANEGGPLHAPRSCRASGSARPV